MQQSQISLEVFADEILPSLAGVETFVRGDRQIWRGRHPERGKVIVVHGYADEVDLISER